MTASDSDAFKLVETCTGAGDVSVGERVLAGVGYSLRRFQGLARSGLPVPGLHRIEGELELSGVPDREALVGSDLTLDTEDGRSLRLTLVGEDGRVLAVGHGPSKCGCC